MIVEFIGSSGAGKTTLISRVRPILAETCPVQTAFELVAGRVHLPPIDQPALRNLAQDAISLPYLLGSLRASGAGLGRGARALVAGGLAGLSANYVRSLLRKLGTHELLRRNARGGIVLVDEGVLGAVHPLFVFAHPGAPAEEIKSFVERVPHPDLVVYVRAPIDQIVERTLVRPDAPRELRGQPHRVVRRALLRAVEVFDTLGQMPMLRDRLLVVDNDETTPVSCPSLAQHVAGEILTRAGR